MAAVVSLLDVCAWAKAVPMRQHRRGGEEPGVKIDVHFSLHSVVDGTRRAAAGQRRPSPSQRLLRWLAVDVAGRLAAARRGGEFPEASGPRSEARERMRRGLAGRRRIDHRLDFGNDVGGEAGQPCMLPDHRLVLGEIDAERLVVGDVAFLPLDARSQLGERVVRLMSDRAEALLVSWRRCPATPRSMTYFFMGLLRFQLF